MRLDEFDKNELIPCPRGCVVKRVLDDMILHLMDDHGYTSFQVTDFMYDYTKKKENEEMTASFYSSIETNTRERIALAPGSYGTSKLPGLKILAYIDKASKLDKSGAMRHSFLVSATQPSRDQLQKANGESNPLLEDYSGTAFLSLTIHDLWRAPESVALAFTEASRNKEGKVNHDFTEDAKAAGAVSAESLHNCRVHFQKLATDKVIAANTPEESMAAAIETQYRKELIQVSIKVGTFFNLQDWLNKGDKSKRDINMDITKLVGCEFSGKVEKSGVGDGSEVVSVYSR